MKTIRKSIYLPKSVYQRILRHEYYKGLDIEKMGDNPVCPRCERVAMRDIGYAKNNVGRCPYCGFHGVMKTTLREYAEKGLYK